MLIFEAKRLADLGCLVSANPWYHHVLADKYTEVLDISGTQVHTFM